MSPLARYDAAVTNGTTVTGWRAIAAALDEAADEVSLKEACQRCDNCQIGAPCGSREQRMDKLRDRATDARARAERLAARQAVES